VVVGVKSAAVGAGGIWGVTVEAVATGAVEGVGAKAAHGATGEIVGAAAALGANCAAGLREEGIDAEFVTGADDATICIGALVTAVDGAAGDSANGADVATGALDFADAESVCGAFFAAVDANGVDFASATGAVGAFRGTQAPTEDIGVDGAEGYTATARSVLGDSVAEGALCNSAKEEAGPAGPTGVLVGAVGEGSADRDSANGALRVMLGTAGAKRAIGDSATRATAPLGAAGKEYATGVRTTGADRATGITGAIGTVGAEVDSGM
jgi:hypothetical protein